MSDSYNCGKHTRRDIPHWDGDKWCDGRKPWPQDERNRDE